MDTESNSPFAKVALQQGLIDQTKLKEALSACAIRPDATLADILQERGWITTAQREEIERQIRDLLPTPSVADTPTPEDARKALAWLMQAKEENTPRYEVHCIRAKGGIGQIWEAHDRQLGRTVALKELKSELEDEPALRRRFLVEAQITGQLEHPGIVPIYELVAPDEDTPPYYTMRMIRGKELSKRVREYHEQRRAGLAGTPEFRHLLQAFVSICDTLAYAHARGVIHRDLKGDNIILGPFGEVLVLDWGLAKILTTRSEKGEEFPVHLDEQLYEGSVAGTVVGTPAYMAPEQARGEVENIDIPTDVFGLGAVLYEILTNRPPYVSDEPNVDQRNAAELHQAIHRELIAPRTRSHLVPKSLDAVCCKALEAKPEDRYPSARALGDEVKR